MLKNRIAQALIKANRDWNDILEPVSMPVGKTLAFQSARTSTLYFCYDGLVSELVNLADDGKDSLGNEMQVAMFGHNDVVGIGGLFGSGVSTSRMLVDLGGSGLACSTQAAKRLLADDLASREILIRYAMFRLASAGQLAAVRALLPVVDQLAIWLWQTSTILGSDEISFTHVHISKRMGIRRASITDTGIPGLVEAGLMAQLDRGRLQITDPGGLFARVQGLVPVLVRRHQMFFEDLDIS